MKLNSIFNGLTLIAVALCSVEAYAYSDDKEKEICRNPKVQEFTLPVYSETSKIEAQPEAEFSFVVSGWAEPKKFKLSAKNVDIPFTVQSTETYHKVKAKLPASLTGQSVRINARIPAVLGCYTTIGWLIKVADKATPATPATTTGTESPAAPAVQAGTPAPKAPAAASTAPKAEAPVPAVPATPPATAPTNKPVTIE
jgi:hypothetical protein